MQRVDLGEVPYEQAMQRMATWTVERRAGTAPDRLFLLSHPAVITYGRTTPLTDLPADLPGIPTVLADRGGQATYHGPGQLIGYLVLDLHERGPGDIVRWLENGLVAALGDLGFSTVRRDTPKGSTSLVGVWTPDGRKLASIGMRIRGGVTSHGFALNIDPDLSVFDSFVACGLDDVAMTSLRQLSVLAQLPMPTEAAVRDAVFGHLRKQP
ncbi:lipoyl(octanoyl) transferase [Actinoplanes sp. ATCC 53533]|uniref:lipoyl(octanoyl) transferase LipB n=1 Tax=Actinoplanes sp. ATCC 53533 TaxID=1288362 RepID=UPI000F7B7BC0|nr:lipoyl(octanoyl) transferase LipB [Actinoplanes sp. ATCC 53533]RSM67537.1 lipoyl(octanoyl) transferase [Actinoplanes sp. ATCC 53533]